MGYLVSHLRNVEDTRNVNVMKMESGPIYDIRYKSETASKNRYLVVALNIFPYTGTKQDKLLHCLDLDVISPVEMKKLVIQADGLKEMEIDSRGTTILELNVPDGRANREFYNKKIVRLMNQIPKCYKTLKLSNIQRVEICNYDYRSVLDPATLRRFGIFDED